MTIHNRQQILALVAIGAVALLVFDKLILTPLVDGWKERSTRIAELTMSVNRGELLADRETAIRDQWQEMRSHMLPVNPSTAVNEMLKAFDRWSQASRISITSIQPQWRVNNEDSMALECRADAFGSLEAITRFLYELEKDPLALRIEAVEIRSRDDNSEQLSLGLQLSGVLFTPQQP